MKELIEKLEQAMQYKLADDKNCIIDTDLITQAIQALSQSDWIKVEEMKEEIKKLKFMIDNKLGWEDMNNDIKYPNEL